MDGSVNKLSEKVIRCGECGEVVLGTPHEAYPYTPVNMKSADAAIEYRIPFVCNLCGSIRVPYKPLRGVVFLWKPAVPEKVGSIIIPDYEGRRGNARDLMRQPTAVVMAFGPGAYTPEGSFVPSEGIEVGDLVLYNKDVPWNQMMFDSVGVEHNVILCSYVDIIGVRVKK